MCRVLVQVQVLTADSAGKPAPCRRNNTQPQQGSAACGAGERRFLETVQRVTVRRLASWQAPAPFSGPVARSHGLDAAHQDIQGSGGDRSTTPGSRGDDKTASQNHDRVRQAQTSPPGPPRTPGMGVRTEEHVTKGAQTASPLSRHVSLLLPVFSSSTAGLDLSHWVEDWTPRGLLRCGPRASAPGTGRGKGGNSQGSSPIFFIFDRGEGGSRWSRGAAEGHGGIAAAGSHRMEQKPRPLCRVWVQTNWQQLLGPGLWTKQRQHQHHLSSGSGNNTEQQPGHAPGSESHFTSPPFLPSPPDDEPGLARRSLLSTYFARPLARLFVSSLPALPTTPPTACAPLYLT